MLVEIVNQQTDFFKEGLSGLKPLSLKDVANSCKYAREHCEPSYQRTFNVNTERMFYIKIFFSVSIATTESGDGTAAAAVRHLIKTVISNENPKKPLSDDAIASFSLPKRN